MWGRSTRQRRAQNRRNALHRCHYSRVWHGNLTCSAPGFVGRVLFHDGPTAPPPTPKYARHWVQTAPRILQ